MNILRTVMIASVVALASAGSSALSQQVVPATPATSAISNIAGNWTLTVDTPNGQINLTMSVVQNGHVINVKITDDKGTYDYDGTVQGNEVKFGHDSKNVSGLRIEYIGTVVANAMTGKAIFGKFGEGTFTGTRQ